MNYTTAIFLVNSAVRCVSVSYELLTDGKGKPPFALFKTLDPTIQVGDYVVVPTGTRHDMTVCRVEAVDLEVDFDSPYQMEWLVQRLDLAANKAIKGQEAQAIERIRSAEKRAKQDELKRKLLADNPALSGLTAISGDVEPPALPSPHTDESDTL